MNALFDWLGQPQAQRLGWTLLHFVWQGVLLALLYGVARAALHRHSANARYLAGGLALLLMAAAPVWTFARLGSAVPHARWTVTLPEPLPGPVSAAWPAVSAMDESATVSGLIGATAQLATAAVPWLTLFWLAGVAALSLRLSAGWLRVRGWQQQAADAFDHGLHTRLRSQLTVSTPSDTYLIEIQVEGTDPLSAAEIANTLAEAHQQYQESRAVRRPQAAQDGLKVLQENVSRWTEKVQERQRLVDTRREQLGVSDATDESPGTPGSLEREMASSMAQQLALARAEHILHRTKLDELRKLNTNELRRAILTMLPGEEILPKLLIDLATTQQELAKLRQEYSEEHPSVQKALSILATIEDQVNERVTGMIAGTERYVTALQARDEDLQKGVDEGRERLIAEARSWRELSRLKRDLETEQRIRDALYLRAMQEQVDAKMPPPGTVEVVDRAEPPLRPARLWRPPWATPTCGLGFACCLGGLTLRSLAGRSKAVTAPPPAGVTS